MNCISCRVTFEDQRYEISKRGEVRPCMFFDGGWSYGETVESDLAARVRREASRQRRNRNARERADVMRSLGLVKTPYGWE